eukprot:scaffold2984_cov80-Cylindrotheca_fusiformis.AAC.1
MEDLGRITSPPPRQDAPFANRICFAIFTVSHGLEMVHEQTRRILSASLSPAVIATCIDHPKTSRTCRSESHNPGLGLFNCLLYRWDVWGSEQLFASIPRSQGIIHTYSILDMAVPSQCTVLTHESWMNGKMSG